MKLRRQPFLGGRPRLGIGGTGGTGGKTGADFGSTFSSGFGSGFETITGFGIGMGGAATNSPHQSAFEVRAQPIADGGLRRQAPDDPPCVSKYLQFSQVVIRQTLCFEVGPNQCHRRTL